MLTLAITSYSYENHKWTFEIQTLTKSRKIANYFVVHKMQLTFNYNTESLKIIHKVLHEFF